MDTKIGDVNSEWPANNNLGCSPSNKSVACPSPNGHAAAVAPTNSSSTLGGHLARRLVEIGVTDVFSVPGDFNLTLLDHLLAEPGLNLVGCCNELNAGYAADGYARSRGVGACVVTFTVGGLSIINAIAGAYSENLPVICIVGGPNSNDYGTHRILHHTIGLPDFSQEYRCFQTITCAQVIVNHLDDAHELIDYAISTALLESKPVYISVGCNLAAIQHPSFSREPVPYSLSPRWTGSAMAANSAAVYNPKTTALKPQNCPEHIAPPSKEKQFPYAWLRWDLVQTRVTHLTSANVTFSGGKAQQLSAFRYQPPPSDLVVCSPPSISEVAARPRQVRIFAWSVDNAWLTVVLSAMEELMVFNGFRIVWWSPINMGMGA